MEPQSMDQQKRLFLTIAISMAVLFAWQMFMGPKPEELAARADAGAVLADASAATPAAVTPPAEIGAAPDAGVEADGGAPAAQPAAPTVSEQFVELDSPSQQLTFSNRGGGVTKAVIKKGESGWPEYKFQRRKEKGEEHAQAVDLVHITAGQPFPAASELTGDVRIPFDALYTAEKREDGVTFTANNGGAKVVKSYTFNPNGYELRVTYTVTNASDQPKKLGLGLVYPTHVDPAKAASGGFFSPPPDQVQVSCRHDRSSDHVAFKKDGKTETFKGPVQFVGYNERYFLGAIFPRFADATSCVVNVEASGAMVARLDVDLGTVAPGQAVTKEFGLYFGPKALTELSAVSDANAAGGPMVTRGPKGKAEAPAGGTGFNPELTESIEFGWWAVICHILLKILKVFQAVVVNWGIAIVLLTVLVKLLVYPLTKKSMESMESMKKLQPKLEELKKKYGADKEKLNLETMKLYSENKVNPFGGCITMLIQMPIWIALYRTLLESFELYREPLLPVWITDLTAADPFYVLPLLMGVTMFITQKMQPQSPGMDPSQAKIMLYFMPVFFTFIMLNLPAGLTLYIFTNNLLSIAQQKWLQHRMKVKAAAVPA